MSEYSLKDLIGRKVIGIIDAKDDQGVMFEGGVCILVSSNEPVYNPVDIAARVEMELEELSPQGKRIDQLKKDKSFLNKFIKKDDDGKSKDGTKGPSSAEGNVEVTDRPSSGDNKSGGSVPGGVQELQHEIKQTPSGENSGDGLL